MKIQKVSPCKLSVPISVFSITAKAVTLRATLSIYKLSAAVQFGWSNKQILEMGSETDFDAKNGIVDGPTPPHTELAALYKQ